MNHDRSTQPPGAARRPPDVAALIATIAGSSIRVPAAPDEALPPRVAWALRHSNNVDTQILEWIASHGRGKRRRSGWLM